MSSPSTLLGSTSSCSTSEVAVKLFDVENSIYYHLKLNLEDYSKLQSDENFARALLFHAKCASNNCNPSVEPEIEEDLENPSTEENSFTEAISGKIINCWSYNQTLLLINSMGSHIDEFNHPKKRKDVFEHILNDLTSNGYSNITIEMVKNKWKSLTRSYTKAKDNKTRTGRGPSKFQFFDALDEILGNKPANKCTHSLNSSDVRESIQVEVSDDSPINNLQPSDDEPDKENFKKRKRVTEKTLRKEYVKMKEEEYFRKQKRHAERVELEKEKMAIEKQKLKLLETILQTKLLNN